MSSNDVDEAWEDDEMEELFSFGTEGAGIPSISEPVVTDSMTLDPSIRDRAGSADSFLEMLEVDAKEHLVVSVLDTKSNTEASNAAANIASDSLEDPETQEILDWLDQSESIESELAPEHNGETQGEVIVADTCIEVSETEKTSPSVSMPVLDPEFESLEDALTGEYAAKSNVEQIRNLFLKENMQVKDEVRPELWSRIVCNRTLSALQSSSVADSYNKWQQTVDIGKCSDERSMWIKNEAMILAERITCLSQQEAAEQLTMLLLFHFTGDKAKDMDPLIPPVACTILSAGIPSAAASVVLSNIMPAFMPLLALTQEERFQAAIQLHSQFYLLSCYHLPLLVFHLDRYAPGWYWPKKLEKIDQENFVKDLAWRNTENHGMIPQSWLISQMAGECNGTFMNPKWLLSLWDLILTSSNNSLRFFLSLAVLEKYADSLLMIKGDELLIELKRVLEFKEFTTLEGFAITSEEETTASEAIDWVHEWCSRARSLWESTPRSVVLRLRKAEDEAVSVALTERQRKAEDDLQAKLEAEAKAHKDAMDAEKEKRAEEARNRLNRLRLVAFYREFAPDKEGNVNVIMETFAGRFDVLDAKLKQKYGHGFSPALPPKPLSKNASKLLSTMNISLSNPRKRMTSLTKMENASHAANEHQVTVRVCPHEVLPIICWAKEKDPLKKASSRPSESLKYYLVDSRPEETVQEQGGFPTALAMPPEALLDPDRMKQQEEIFESLRGAAHIVVMGEGFSDVPSLYGQKMNPSLAQLISEDDSRTSLCALFFAKKGFPFVSILQGGFCGAHAWLARHGPKYHLYVDSVLVDYMGENSMFGALEKAYREQKEFANASAAEKTTMALEGLLVKSMAAITVNKIRLENLAAAASAGSNQLENPFSNFFKNEDSKEESKDTFTSSPLKAAAAVERSFTTFFKSDQSSSIDSSKFRIPFPTSRMNTTNVNSSSTATTSVPTSTAVVNKEATIETEDFSKAAVAAPETAVTNQSDSSKKNRFASLGASARFGGIGNAINNSIAKIGIDKPIGETQPGTESRLASFGAAFNKQLQNAANSAVPQQIPNVLKRNPFARFGARDTTDQQKGNHKTFGLNPPRNPLSKFRSGAVHNDETEIDFQNLQ
jgi:hypothetical protein